MRNTKLKRITTFFTTVRGTLVALLLSAVLPMLLFQVVDFYSRFEERRSQELDSSLEMARAVAATFDAYVQDVLRQELALGLAISSSDAVPSASANLLLAGSAREYPSIRHYAWADPSGRILAFSLEGGVGGDIGDRPYFQEIIGGKPWAISDLTVGRFTNEIAFLIARGIRDDRGTLKGVITASVNPVMLGGVLAVPRSGGGAISVIDRQGIQVFSYPETIVSLEKRANLRAEPIAPATLNGDEGTGTFVSALDGKERMVGLAPIRSVGWTARASRPTDEVMAPLHRDLVGGVGLLAFSGFLALAAAVVIGGRIVIPVSRLREHALVLAGGKLTNRIEVSGAREIEDLAEAFNLMAGEIQVREERFRAAFEHAAVGVALVDLCGRFIQVNQSLCQILGYPERDLLATTFLDITHPDDLAISVEHMKKASSGEIPSYHIEKRYIHKEGRPVWVLVSASAVRGPNSGISYFIAQVQDITERKLGEEERNRLQLALQELSLLDELTRHYNRRGFLTLAQQQLRLVDRGGQKALLFFFDMDGLKQINDSYGHSEGDRAIREVAQILRETFRMADIVARLGGDEFAALAVSSGDPLAPILNRLKTKVTARNAVGDLPYWLSFSVGSALYDPGLPRSLEELIAAADRAMYEEKRAKRRDSEVESREAE